MEEEFAENVFTITDVDIEQEIRENDESHGKETEMVEETEDDGEERMYSYPNLSFKEKILRHASPSGSFASNCSRVAAGNLMDVLHYVGRKLSRPAHAARVTRQYTHQVHYDSVDVYQGMEEDPRHNSAVEAASQRHRTLERALAYILAEQTWLFLGVLGISIALLTIVQDYAITAAITNREAIMARLAPNEWWLQLLIFTAISVGFCGSAGLVTRYVSPQAAGSGIPEMKSILSGVILPRYLNYRTFLAKTVGLCCAVIGGLSIGREGPAVHISAIVANQLSRISIFNRIRTNEALKFQMLLAGCAVGVSTIFGAPVGETTTTYYLLQNLWKAFFCAVSGAVVVKLLGNQGFISMFETTFPENAYTTYEIVVFAGIGILFGYLGAVFVKLLLRLVLLRRNYKILAETRYAQLMAIAVLTALLTFPLTEVRDGDKGLINALFLPQPFESYRNSAGEEGAPSEFLTQNNIFVTLSVYLAAKWVLTLISLGLPIPCGLYTPVFLVGAAGGRMVGELMALLFGHSICPGGYAVVGAAAMSAGVTRTVSTAVIVFELTGELSYLLPVLIAVLLATGVGNMFSRSSYDALLEQKRLPYMPPFGNIRAQENERFARDIMRSDLRFVCRDSTYLQVAELLDTTELSSIPLVDSKDTMVLVGSVPRAVLERLVEKHDMMFKHETESNILKNVHRSSDRRESVKFLQHAYRRQQSIDQIQLTSRALPPSPHSSPGTNAVPQPHFDWSDSEDETEEEEASALMVESILVRQRHQYFQATIAAGLEACSEQIDASPFQVPDEMSFFKLHYLFAMLGINLAYVTRHGRLVGVVTKKDFLARATARAITI